MNSDCGIYSITSPSGKQYIGQARSFRDRWATHRRCLKAGLHHCKGLQNAYKKYGDALVFAKIALVPVDQLDAREQEQIDARPRAMLYNTALYVTSPTRGLKVSAATRARLAIASAGRVVTAETRLKLSLSAKNMSDEQREKIAAALRGRTRDPGIFAKISAANMGKSHTDATRQKISATMTGIIRTAEYRAKISAALIGKRFGDNNILSMPVICIETSDRFANARAAAKWLRENGKPKATSAHVCAASIGKRGSAYGYRWRYADALPMLKNNFAEALVNSAELI